MRYFKKPIWPLSTVATIALVSVGLADTAPSTPSLTIEEAAAALAAVEQQLTLRKWTLETGGMYAIKAPANSGVQVSVDGLVVVDATGTQLPEVGEIVTALITLQAGDHTIKVTGLADSAALGTITLNATGEEPQSILSLTTELDAEEAERILASRSALNPSATTSSRTTASASQASRTPFSIGGGSSQATQTFTDATTASAVMQENSPAAAASSGSRERMRLSLPTSSGRIASVASPRRMSSGGNSDGGDSGGDNGGGNNGGGNGGGGGTPPPPSDETQISPLTPPTNVTLTQVIELTAAGNEEGEVPNTGTTLFGAVMDNSMYDIVNVTVGANARETTVDVGPETGQFAVRLFEEDFAQGAELRVMLTGGSTADENIASEPVSYTVTGMPVTDGITQALSRITYGPTPALYARLRGIGFEAYVEEQLDPGSINDSAFRSTRPERLIRRTTSNGGRMFRSLLAYEIASAAYSERQLQEVMGNFWANHFYASTKDTNIRQQNILDREFYRDNALGNFEDMLLYSARSPLMSQFLDNDQNRRGRINENYGREILELSSVGVDAGYGPEDVIAVSRIFTGWAYQRTNPNAENVAQEYEFDFFPDRHDTEDKFIPFLNMTIAGREGEAGVQEGEELIAILAQHPSTRSFVCGKIVQLLVADTPPAEFVQACATAWEESDGEIVPMLRAILLDPRYIQTVEYQRNKGKTPFEYAVSVIRAFGASSPIAPGQGDTDREEDLGFYSEFRDAFEDSGYDILGFGIPTGLPEVGSAWANSASMIEAYQEMTDVARNRERYNIDLLGEVTDAGLETAEEVAAYLLTVATADRFTLEEYEALVEVLKGDDGIFEPSAQDEGRALERAMGLLVVTPSFQLQ